MLLLVAQVGCRHLTDAEKAVTAEREAQVTVDSAKADSLEDQRLLKKNANILASKTYYYKDSRTGFCFAVAKGYHESMMASVNCDSIPARLLGTSDLNYVPKPLFELVP